ncbi:MAG: diaminopropionate ammonia-lyase, partial [Hyphomicrobiales bacterium]
MQLISIKRRDDAVLTPVERAAIGRDAPDEVRRFLSACPAYKPTPLAALPALAAELGVGSVHIKDEGQRLGLLSFKALG